MVLGHQDVTDNKQCFTNEIIERKDRDNGLYVPPRLKNVSIYAENDCQDVHQNVTNSGITGDLKIFPLCQKFPRRTFIH